MGKPNDTVQPGGAAAPKTSVDLGGKLSLSRRQWSFLWAGVVFGVAQIVYMITLLLAGGDETKPITVTTDLGKMFRGLEFAVGKVLGFDLQLYGDSVDGVASGGAFTPGVGWPIVGMVIGGTIVALAEKESRAWVKYPAKVLGISFLGGMIFSYGTRLAGGCTLNHLLGGVPMMSIHSTFTVIMMAAGGATAFGLLTKLGVGQYFKHQETKAYCEDGDDTCVTYDPKYQWSQNPWYWVGLAFSVSLLAVAVFGGLFNPEALEHLKDGEVAEFGKSVASKGWIYVLGTLLAGIIGGVGMAKSGFGTECALVSLETAGSMRDHDNRYAKWGVPKITRTLMRGYLPIIGLAASWVLTGGFVVFMWMLGTEPGFGGSVKYQFTAGSLIGGFLLGLGAVMMIGCEIRSYMRIGMGYLNTMLGFIGFAVGYLPYTLFVDGHKSFLADTVMIDSYKWYELVAPNSVGLQKVIYVVWIAALVFFLRWLIRKGASNIGLTEPQLINLNTEDLQRAINAETKDGMVGGVNSPEPAIFS